MTSCHRFETEGLPRFVAGAPLDTHAQSCPDCQAALASYQKVADALHQAKEAFAPPGDWEAKVWSRIANQRAARPPARWALLGLGAAFAALAIFFVSSVGGPDALALTSQVERSTGPRVRGGARGKLGDLRVYRGTNELVFHCARSPACVRSKDGLEARVTLDRAGTYRTLLIAADGELPAPSGDLDADYAEAMRSGKATESLPVEVL